MLHFQFEGRESDREREREGKKRKMNIVAKYRNLHRKLLSTILLLHQHDDCKYEYNPEKVDNQNSYDMLTKQH